MTLRSTSKARWAVAAFLFVLASVAMAADHVNVSTGGTLAGGPLALRGYDPVSYFATDGPELGSAEFTAMHDGAAYRFTSAKNKARFEKSPERFVPAFGGFCAYGVAVGSKFDGDPLVYEIVDGRVYLNLNPEIQKTWAEDTAANIEKANENWLELRNESVKAAK